MDDEGLLAIAETWAPSRNGRGVQVDVKGRILGALRELSAAHEKELAEWKVRSIYFQREEDQLRARLDDAERLLRQYAAHEPQVFTFLTPSTPAPPVEPQEAAKPFEKGAGEYGTKISDAALAPDPLAPVLARLDELDGFARAKAVSDGEVTRLLAGMDARMEALDGRIDRIGSALFDHEVSCKPAEPDVAGPHAFACDRAHCDGNCDALCTWSDCKKYREGHAIPSKPDGL